MAKENRYIVVSFNVNFVSNIPNQWLMTRADFDLEPKIRTTGINTISKRIAEFCI